MSLDFVRQRVNSQQLNTAVKQQEQLLYFTKSSVQEDVSASYYEQWAERNYNTNDHFLNFVKSVFKTDNFLSFFKYFRNPIASAELINERIITPLSRVFYSEDSYFKYSIRNENENYIPELETKEFNEKIFNTLLFRYNDIIVEGLKDINTPFREVIKIDNVISIESKDSVIKRIAYSAELVIEDICQKGYMYLDDERYIFYYNDNNNSIEVEHDLGKCPADYVSSKAFNDEDVVRSSTFSFVRSKLEEYNFLKTLQRMTEPNGSIPIVTKLQTKSSNDKRDIKGSSDKQPNSTNLIGSQHANEQKEVQGSSYVLQTGNLIEVPIIRKQDGGLDMDVVSNFLKFFYIPVEAMEYLNRRIKEIEQSVIVSVLGDYSEANEASKNELQVTKSYVSKQDKLRALSLELSRIRNISDYKFLALKYGKDNVKVDCFYGSDFFLESEEDLYKLFKESPNPIERKDLLLKISRNKNRFNKDKMERQVLLYHLLPYCSDYDFDKAITRGVDDTTFQYQTRFNYWIGLFESEYGDITIFYDSIDADTNQKLVLINNLILDIIKENTKESDSDKLLNNNN